MYSTESDILAEKNRGTPRLAMEKKWDTSITNTKKYKMDQKGLISPRTQVLKWGHTVSIPFRIGEQEQDTTSANSSDSHMQPPLHKCAGLQVNVHLQAENFLHSFLATLQQLSWEAVADTCGFIHDLCSFWFNNRYESLCHCDNYEYIQAQYLLTCFLDVEYLKIWTSKSNGWSGWNSSNIGIPCWPQPEMPPKWLKLQWESTSSASSWDAGDWIKYGLGMVGTYQKNHG